MVARGKIRDSYAVGTDHIGAFDAIMGKPIPGKGALLTQMSKFWFEHLKDICPNHLTGDAPESAVSADTKFEFGLTPAGELVLMDEVLTPDSSGYWPVEGYQEGCNPQSYDKQFLRDWLEAQPWDKAPRVLSLARLKSQGASV